jgi:aminoglycoside phosphotransferase (APT) family kinase protein
MAMANTLDPATIERGLGKWLSTKTTDGNRVRLDHLEVLSSSGMSNTIVMFDTTWVEHGSECRQELVARIQPADPGVFLTYDLEREYRVMKILAESTAIPLPMVRWLETDPEVLGAPFMIMDRVSGQIAADDPPFTTVGWITELTPSQRATVYDNGLQVLADIHAVDWKRLGLGFLSRSDLGATGVEQKLTHYQQTYAWAAGERQYPTIEAALRWAADNLPTGEPTVLCHGDARLANLVYPDDLSVAAVLDWELATLGSPELDLGWWLFVMRHHTHGIGAQLPEGFPTPEQTISRYTQLTGHRVKHIEFYEIFAAIFLSVTMIQVVNVLTTAGLLPAESTMAESNPATHILASLLGITAPDGASSTFIGKR